MTPEEIKQRATNVANFLLDHLSGGRLGYQPYPVLDKTKIKPGQLLNIFFTGASTGSEGQDWYNLSRFDKPGVHHQNFRWGDSDKARQFVKNLPKDVKLHIVGYSHGAESANQLARQTGSPLDLIAPVTRNYKEIVDWARVHQPTNDSPLYSINNFVSTLGGTVPKSQFDQEHLRSYQGQHCNGVRGALCNVFGDQGIKPTEQELQREAKKSPLYRKLVRYAPLGIGAAGGVLGWNAAKRLGAKSLFLKATAGGVSGVTLYALSKYILNRMNERI